MKYFIGLAIVVFSSCSIAKQVSFNRTLVDGQYHFEYQWLDHTDTQYEMAFALDAKQINNSFRHFKALSPSLIKSNSIRAIQQEIAKYDPRKGRISLVEQPNGVEFKLSSTNRDWLNKTSKELDGMYDKFAQEYIRSQYYTNFTYFGYRTASTNYYRPDHARFAEESIEMLKPIAEEIKRILPRVTARGVAQFILSWLQTIPYSEIESRTESNGAGFLPPPRLLTFNKGDCDSKVTLMASLMKLIFPRIRVAIVYIPQHALIGFNVSTLNDDEKLEYDNSTFVLSEPVGPGLLPFAEVSERSQRYIDSGNYSIEVF
jgi:hypothetical protein